MEFFALVIEGMVREVIEVEAGGVPLADRYHPDFVAKLRPASAEVLPGFLWDGQGFTPPLPPSLSEAEARAARDARLAACDWTQLADAPLTAEARAAWASYRAALRALPGQPGWPATITWPEAPR